MATLVLGAAGAALGSSFGGVGAILGRAAGALAGYALDRAFLGGGARRRRGRGCQTCRCRARRKGRWSRGFTGGRGWPGR